VAAVVGGGDVAVEDAIYLGRFCEKVYLIHRRDSLRAAKSLQDKLFALENVEVIWNHVVEEIKGETSVQELSLMNTQDNSKNTLSVNGVFVAVGIKPDTELVKGQIDCNDAGYVIAGEDCKTSLEGVYVAGDARQKPLRQIITAVSDGANAATYSSLFLMK
jgi:thioredoxin reductase (NADPH)